MHRHFIYKSFKHYKVREIERKYKIQNTKYKIKEKI
jgi:hypothetical protein